MTNTVKRPGQLLGDTAWALLYSLLSVASLVLVDAVAIYLVLPALTDIDKLQLWEITQAIFAFLFPMFSIPLSAAWLGLHALVAWLIYRRAKPQLGATLVLTNILLAIPTALLLIIAISMDASTGNGGRLPLFGTLACNFVLCEVLYLLGARRVFTSMRSPAQERASGDNSII